MVRTASFVWGFLADKIYMSKASRKILKEYKIKTCCKPLGRLPKEPRSLEHLEKMTKAIGERNEAKCSFGTDKKNYRAYIRAKYPQTAVCRTRICYFVKNVMKFIRELCLALFEFWLNLWTDAIAKYRVHGFASMAIY
ncbi:hypothetical protein HMPREF0673_01546 [Leyella stercorea DSM 18206]|uniref:Transposase DDE domain-containing protein n=2 Tax=Leyella stercorea TaxID=363265 RepID=G6AY37_9BACT|nr:hypothetical protein HMPREF0673_01546 [Leyella stercorea DSM 18206]HAH77686.1 hypothetical protein [Leyella stercorea]